MKNNFVFLGLILFFAGCAVLDSGAVKTDVSIGGLPGAALKKYEESKTDLRLKTTPGGFLVWNEDSCLGAIINQDEGRQKDVYLYVRRHLQGTPTREQTWVLYSGSAEIKTPKGWIAVDGLEAIHFDTPFCQKVTLRLRQPDGSAKEMSFDALGYRVCGNQYERTNALFIRLPQEVFKLEVFTHEGRWIFKRIHGYPYIRYLDLAHWLDPVGAKVMGIWVGWKIIL